MDWDRARARVGGGLVLAGCLAVLGCGGAPASTATPPVATPAATAAPSIAPTPAASPTRVPLPTFGVSVEPATEAPEGAISIELHYEGITPQYDPSVISAPAGTLVLFLANTDKVRDRHDFNLGPEIGKEQAGMSSIGGQTAVVLTIADLPPGTYAFWCSVHDHYKYGMVGTLTVTP